MESIQNILKRAGDRDEIAAECGVASIAVYRWGQNNSIPAKHMAGVLRVSARNGGDVVTASEILAAHDATDTAEGAA